MLAAPGLLLGASLLGLACYCDALLADALAGAARPGGVGFWLAILGFGAAVAVGVALACLHTARRVAGPEVRLCRALQRLRRGDVGFRISLRRGDLLTELAAECNALAAHLAERTAPPADGAESPR